MCTTAITRDSGTIATSSHHSRLHGLECGFFQTYSFLGPHISREHHVGLESILAKLQSKSHTCSARRELKTIAPVPPSTPLPHILCICHPPPPLTQRRIFFVEVRGPKGRGASFFYLPLDEYAVSRKSTLSLCSKIKFAI